MTYTCPMHPEVESDKPGRCPKCGMKLVTKDEVANKSHDMHEETSANSYTPLIVIIGLIFVTSFAIAFRNSAGFADFISYFMTGFFIVFSAFKLMDLKGFAEGYSTYDLLAQRVYSYGYIYPFIELFFGLSMILNIYPREILIAELLVMTFSGIGVAIKLAKGEKFQCACLGTFLKVPLTKVTLIEDFGMALLALIMLLITY